MPEEINPYAPPQTEALLPENAEARASRMENLRAESHAKALGVFFIFAGLLALLAVDLHARAIEKEFGVLNFSWTQATPLLTLLAGFGLCFLQRWAWVLAVVYYGTMGVVNVVTLPQSIVALLIGVAVLRFLLLGRTRRIFSADYAVTVAATSDLHSPVASWGWVLGFLCALFALFIISVS